ncbi:MAG: hypothetical protein HKN15_06190 [Xanthomonadales bacterium]|nr:hypothetical protein [Xanthomonadales bacterium]
MQRITLLLVFIACLPGKAMAGLETGLVIEVDGQNRIYDLYIPDGFAGQDLPLVIDMHGLGLSSASQRFDSGFRELADIEGLVVAWPQGINSEWNINHGQNSKDVAFMRALVAELVITRPVDPSRVYANGFSLGGALAYLLACEAAEIFAAIGAMASSVQTGVQQLCAPAKPVPVFSVRATNDNIVPYNGGIVTVLNPPVEVLSSAQVFQFWRTENACTGSVSNFGLGGNSSCTRDSQCSGDAEVVECSVLGNALAPHQIWDNADGVDLAVNTWNFFEQFSRPELAKVFAINAGLNDAWVSDQAPLQGMFVTVFTNLGVVFVAWFTFDSMVPPDPDTATFGADDQRWVTGAGVIDGDKVVLTMELTSGGSFNASDPLPVQNGSYGTMTLTFSDCSAAVADYSFPSIGLSGQMNLHRVLDSNVPICEALADP